MISWSTNSLSLAWLMLNPATSWSRAYVNVPPLLTEAALELELGVLLLLLPLLLHAASAVMPASARARPPKIRLFFNVSPPSALWHRRPETGSSCFALLFFAVIHSRP